MCLLKSRNSFQFIIILILLENKGLQPFSKYDFGLDDERVMTAHVDTALVLLLSVDRN